MHNSQRENVLVVEQNFGSVTIWMLYLDNLDAGGSSHTLNAAISSGVAVVEMRGTPAPGSRGRHSDGP